MGSRYVYLGPPGAGKGSQAAITTKRHGIPAISTGAIFREAMSQNTKMGKQISQFVNAGLLVPDKLTNAIVVERLDAKDCEHGFILDGYPRSLVQAKALDAFLAKAKKPLDQVLYFKVDPAIVAERLSKRRMCVQCGDTYHLVRNPSKVPGKCDECGGALIARIDDQPEKIRKRLVVYEEITAPVLDYYKKHNVLVVLDASKTIPEVDAEVLKFEKGHA